MVWSLTTCCVLAVCTEIGLQCGPHDIMHCSLSRVSLLFMRAPVSLALMHTQLIELEDGDHAEHYATNRVSDV